MPLFKGCGCKAKPANAIAYITDKRKATIVTSYALDDRLDYARQFAETAKLFGKAQKFDSRKYYPNTALTRRTTSVRQKPTA